MEVKSQLLQAMKICRFCFCDKEHELSPIYRKKKDGKHSVPLPLQIMACMAIEVFPNDGMPQFICVNCKQQTQQCYVFKVNCKKAHEALKNFLLSDENELHQPTFQSIKYGVKTAPKEFQVATRISGSGAITESRKLNDGSEVVSLSIQKPQKEEPKQIAQQSPRQTSGNPKDEQEPMDVGNAIEYEIINDEAEDESRPQSVEMVDEMDESVPADTFSCPLCNRMFPSQDVLTMHLKEKHKNERPYHCDLCNKKFATKAELAAHEPVHSGLERLIFQCKLCEKTFAREHLLRRHQLVHNNDYCVRCVKCGKVFSTKADLEEHIFSHHSWSESFSCPICNKNFVFKQGLDRHLLDHETNHNKSYNCNYCDRSFSQAIEQAKHMTEHAGLRPYACKVCKRNFTVSHHLTRHMKCHAALECGTRLEDIVDRYKCDLCSMAFKEQTDLLEHSIVHSIVNVTCVICNTAFTSSPEVQEHIKIHLRGLEFPCEKCNYSFEKADQLEAHTLKHAQMEYEEEIEQELIEEARRPPVITESVPATYNRNDKTPKQSTKPPESNLFKLETTEEVDGRVVYTINMNYQELFSGESEPEAEREPSPERMPPLPEQEHDEFGAEEHDPLSMGYPPEPKPTEMQDERMEDYMEEVDFDSEHQETDVAVEYNSQQLFKCEVDSDDGQDAVALEDGEGEEQEEVVQMLKPIVRNEGTKMYVRKGLKERKLPQVETALLENQNFASPEEINESATPIPLLDLTEDNIPIAKPLQTNLEKIGNKVVKVQKFIMTKKEIKKMQKQGLIEVRGGKVVLKSQNKSILDASIKPVQKDDIDNFIRSAPRERTQLRSYHRRITEREPEE